MSECRSCGTPIRFVYTANGKLMPLDAEPTTDGNVTLEGDIAIVHPPGQLAALDTGPCYTAHFVTCPNADQWRTKR